MLIILCIDFYYKHYEHDIHCKPARHYPPHMISY